MAHYPSRIHVGRVGAMVKDPQDRIEVIRPVVEGLGGSIVAGLAFGEYDTIAILDLPNNEAAATFACGRGSTDGKTTPLLTTAEGLGAASKAGALGYRPPA